jgi:hypothetical protein
LEWPSVVLALTFPSEQQAGPALQQ